MSGIAMSDTTNITRCRIARRALAMLGSDPGETKSLRFAEKPLRNELACAITAVKMPSARWNRLS
ncbi:hypothetical protein KCP69_25725 [Salmonella enterica subsp. enterica]|nr:hypothetical protein KCP69_25725 [Salmonella enterica subsp. enterica]